MLSSGLVGFDIYTCNWMTKTVSAPNRPRIKKKNKRATRRYWRKQPKYIAVPDETITRVGNILYCHPVMLEKFKKEIAKKG